MLVNQRVKAIRLHRRLESRELARLAGLSAGEISHIERKMRTPKIDTAEKIAGALDVTIGFLLGQDEDTNLPLPQALVRQSVKVLLLRSELSSAEKAYVERIRVRESA